ncbi:MAG: hypothetical protein LAT67_01060 [Balneolales bacterium]|nr:hypothetical protein [Balneolales bacterium]
MKLFMGCFTFEMNNESSGSFQILTRAKTLFAAEKQFRKKIKKWVNDDFRDAQTLNIYITDIIEMEDEAVSDSVVLNYLKKSFQTADVQREAGAVLYSPLPQREAYTESWSYGSALDKELFFELKRD